MTATTTTMGGGHIEGSPPASPDDDGDNDDNNGHHPADGDNYGDDNDEWRTRQRWSTRLPTTPTSTGKIKQKMHQ